MCPTPSSIVVGRQDTAAYGRRIDARPTPQRYYYRELNRADAAIKCKHCGADLSSVHPDSSET